ncbi:4'-phosphopantetheinyl transferase [Kitasatospora sp. NPDC001540]|uniref:4'-phosphopantetheinyl transferase family protein n=1 Tax=Kitasatospora sp. NPDC001540 TaxID=3364014 RepID=UPI00367863E2
MIERILPAAAVAVHTAEDADDGYPQEAALVARAVPGRQREFAAARWCARRALAGIGHPAGPILTGPHNEPLWPDGVVGSLTHCAGYRAAAVARAGEIASLGIDAEPHLALPEGVLEAVTRPEELPALAELRAAHPAVHWGKVLFSAKESVYKAWFPLQRRKLGFQDAVLRFDPQECAFRVAPAQVRPVDGGELLTRMRGRFLVDGPLVVTSVVVED